LFGCDSSLWILRGDPQAGGLLSQCSGQVGILDRFSYCYDPEGNLWFLSKDGVYIFPHGCEVVAPVSVSREKIPKELRSIDKTQFCARMAYDFAHRGIHIWVTPYAPGPTRHWWLSLSTTEYREAATSYWPLAKVKAVGFWPMGVASGMEPLALFSRREFIPDSIGASTVLLGCRDGNIRRFSTALKRDDSLTFPSTIDYGPFPLGAEGQDGYLMEIDCTLSPTSGPVFCNVLVAESAEAAARFGGHPGPGNFGYLCFNSGVNHTVRPRARGYSCVLSFSSSGNGPWAIEELIIRRKAAGRRRLV
jgi:hypothetical protein